MTCKERMRRAMDGETADRVPLMCQMSIGHMLLQTGHELAALWNSAEVFAEGLLHRPSLPKGEYRGLE